MKKLILLLASFLISIPSIAEESTTDFTLYLVRHAEKQKIKDNPPLTQCGYKRATQLATLLDNVEIKNVYSTHYKRTMSTAKPTAQSKNVPIKNYNPKGLDQLARQLIQQQQTTLVVGHSNTTPQLAQLLAEQEVQELTEQEYQELYQIQFIGDQKRLTIFKRPMVCH